MSASVAIAARGALPEWAVVKPKRREHIARVAALMDDWSAQLSLDEQERGRWRAAAWLHDALRDEEGEALRAQVPPAARDWPPALLHGPASATRVRAEGCEDEELLDAVAFHTRGHERLGRIGRALYLADFLEPGRRFSQAWRESLRERMPHALDDVLVQVLASRIEHLIHDRESIRPETVGFWNSLVRK